MRRSLLWLLVAAPIMANAQTLVYREDTTAKIFQNNVLKPLAFSGGFNAPQFAQADLNNDGLKDMVVFERGDNTVRPFLNKGTATAASYVYAPYLIPNFPPISEYLKLEDYNRDGISDLIHKGLGGFEVWKGYWNSQNQLAFKYYKELRYNDVSGTINAYSQASDIPGVADVDGDGDLDFFGYDNSSGSIISFYKNCQVEQNLPKDSIKICLPSYCWGHTFQSFIKPFYLAYTCSPAGHSTCKIKGPSSVAKTEAHFGNCILIFDYEGDGDMDLMAGNISFSDVQLLINGRKQNGGADSMVSQDTSWKNLYLPQWPSAFYVDGDGDGKKDLLISPHAYEAAENLKVCHFYKNTGTAAAPVFSYQSDSFFVDGGTDIGTGSSPVLYDYNKDGKPDLFVGSDGYYGAGGQYRSRIAYFQNASSGGQIRFNLITNDFLGLSAQQWYGAMPAMGDLDGDGDDDLVMGHADGTFSYLSNTASGAGVQPVWVLSQPLLKGIAGDTLDVGFYATPYIYDINKDGKPDLLSGSQTGRVAYFQNNPAGGNPGLTKITLQLGDVESLTGNFYSGFSSLWIGKDNTTGNEYLYTGDGNGNYSRFSGFQSGNVTTAYTRVDSAWEGIDVGVRSSITGADLDGDGKTDFITGNRLGGLNFYRLGQPSKAVTEPVTRLQFVMLPNPATETLTISWNPALVGADEPLEVYLLNSLGQVVQKSGANASKSKLTINVGGLPSGIYTVIMDCNGLREAQRLSVMH